MSTRWQIELAIVAAVAVWLGLIAWASRASGALPPSWSVKVSTNSPAQSAFFAVATFNSPNGFAEIQAPNGSTILAGSIVTISNITATLSNGVGTATILLSSNDWKTLMSQPGSSSNLWYISFVEQQ
jgi:hypothetical protein